MQKSEQRMKAICEYIEEYQFEYHRTPTMDLLRPSCFVQK